MIMIINSNWTEWSTIQSHKNFQNRKRANFNISRFEIPSTITPWIVLHTVQLLIIPLGNLKTKNTSPLPKNLEFAWKIKNMIKSYF